MQNEVFEGLDWKNYREPLFFVYNAASAFVKPTYLCDSESHFFAVVCPTENFRNDAIVFHSESSVKWLAGILLNQALGQGAPGSVRSRRLDRRIRGRGAGCQNLSLQI